MSAPESDPLIDPVKALEEIRALIEGSCEKTYGTPAEPLIRAIRGILDKALPPKRRRRMTKP